MLVENILLEREIAYTAGFFDGEGCVSICKCVVENQPYRILIQLTNTNKLVMDWIHSKIGGSIRTLKHRHGNWRTTYVLTLTARDKMLWFMDLVYPFCIVKKSQMDVAREFLSIPKYSRSNRRLELQEQMKALNWRFRKKESVVNEQRVEHVNN